MKDTNEVMIIGRLTRDVDIQYISTGTCLGKIVLACNDTIKEGGEWVDKASFFSVTLWGKLAENLQPYLNKGQQVCVTGRLKQDTWNDKETGSARSNVSIIAQTLQLLQSPKGDR